MEIHHRDAAAPQNLLHGNLVHAVSGSKGVAAHVGYTHHGKHSLEGAVLAIGAVQGREYGVEFRHHLLGPEQAAVGIEIMVSVD